MYYMELDVKSPLNWEVFVTPGIPVASSDVPPGQKQRTYSPISSTLVYGKHDAVLVDTFLTAEQSNDLVKWVAASGKNLTTIYITHGHGDHWFGTGALLSHFLNARAVATPDVVRSMRQLSSPDFITNWNLQFPNQIPNQLVIADELKGNKRARFDFLAPSQQIPVNVSHQGRIRYYEYQANDLLIS